MNDDQGMEEYGKATLRTKYATLGGEMVNVAART